jgi:hydrogenase nickel incorporation protein HypB
MSELCECGLIETEVRRDDAAALKNVLIQNDRVARHNRELFDRNGVMAVNLMSAPGAGKTSLLEASIPTLMPEYRIGVVEGDLATDNDAQRIRALGVPAVQITTGDASHLDARMLHEALHQLELEELDLLFIENVGNLVYPAVFDLGQHHNVALLSVTEGDDKPQKYPVMFRAADLVLLTKTDLLQHVPEFDVQRVHRSLHEIDCGAPLLGLSNRRGAGIDAWCEWLNAKVAVHSLRVASSPRGPHLEETSADAHDHGA